MPAKLNRLVRYDWPLHFVLLFTNWLPDNVAFLRLRGWLASPFFSKCGKNLRLGRDITFYNPLNIQLGSNIYIAKGCWFSAGFPIQIGDEALFGPNVIVASSNHTKENGSFRYGKSTGNVVIIGKGSWIAANCAITAGTDIGNGAVIGANSVVKGEIAPDSLYAGNPAKYIKQV